MLTWAGESSTIFSQSFPVLLTAFIVTPVPWIANALLVNQPGGYDQMGLYSAAFRWYAVLVFVPSTILQPLLPVLSGELAKGDYGMVVRVLKKTCFLSVCVVAPFAMVLCLASPIVMGWYGKGFETGWLTLCVVALTAVVYTLHMNIYQYIFAEGRLWLVFGIQMLWSTTYLLVVYLMRSYGSLTLACANFSAYVLSDALAFLCLLRIVHRRSSEIDAQGATSV